MKWLEGKKTWIGAGLLAVAAVAGYWFGALDGTVATAMLGFALTAVGLGDKADRYVPQILAALDNLRAKK